ncbi:hypothetical protein BDZ88DRAFT_47697 [Geranomyces variabilis]|nr:hypothetical protein BDZ88DRAFT_47697 [Geranomyces variabilis]
MPPPPPPPLLLAVLLLVAPAALSLVAAFFTDRNLSGYGASVPASFYFNVSYVPAELGSALADGGNLSCNFASASARGAAWHAVPIPAASYTPSSPFISCVFVDATERQVLRCRVTPLTAFSYERSFLFVLSVCFVFLLFGVYMYCSDGLADYKLGHKGSPWHACLYRHSLDWQSHQRVAIVQFCWRLGVGRSR